MTMATAETQPQQVSKHRAIEPKAFLDLDPRNPREADLLAAAIEVLDQAMKKRMTPEADRFSRGELLKALHVSHVSPVGLPSLLIEAPVHEGRPPSTALSLAETVERQQKGLSTDAMVRRRWLATSPKFVAVDAAGVDAVIAANAELRRRRAVVEEEDVAEKTARQAAEERSAREQTERAEYSRRAEKWQQLPPEQRLYLAASAEAPEYKPLLEVLARLAEHPHHVSMPASWRPL